MVMQNILVRFTSYYKKFISNFFIFRHLQFQAFIPEVLNYKNTMLCNLREFRFPTKPWQPLFAATSFSLQNNCTYNQHERKYSLSDHCKRNIIIISFGPATTTRVICHLFNSHEFFFVKVILLPFCMVHDIILSFAITNL